MTFNLGLLIAALIQVESGGDVLALGDGGRSVGWLQISAGVVEDVNRVYGRDFTMMDRYDPDRSADICRLYLHHWGNHYEKTTGKAATVEVLARIWNGGPRGWEKQSTAMYWNKVRKAMWQAEAVR